MINCFNNPTDLAQVYITTFHIIGVSVNIYKAYYYIIMLSVLDNINTLL